MIKGVAILCAVALLLAVGATIAEENGVQKLSCIFRALMHGVALTNIHSLCSL